MVRTESISALQQNNRFGPGADCSLRETSDVVEAMGASDIYDCFRPIEDVHWLDRDAANRT
jgi:hypothetical protein